jgi:hypothetical protein
VSFDEQRAPPARRSERTVERKACGGYAGEAFDAFEESSVECLAF